MYKLVMLRDALGGINMDINDMTIRQAKELAAMFPAQIPEPQANKITKTCSSAPVAATATATAHDHSARQ